MRIQKHAHKGIAMHYCVHAYISAKMYSSNPVGSLGFEKLKNVGCMRVVGTLPFSLDDNPLFSFSKYNHKRLQWNAEITQFERTLFVITHKITSLSLFSFSH